MNYLNNKRFDRWKEFRAVDHEYVNANIIFNNTEYPVKIRLKGSTAREHFDQINGHIGLEF